MRMSMTWENGSSRQAGVVMVWVALSMLVILGLGALAVDVGFLMASRNELQNAADAAALAGAGELGNKYYNDEEYDSTWDSIIRAVAKDVGEKNKVAGDELLIDNSDIHIGCWDGSNFGPCSSSSPDAVRVITRRDGENNSNQIITFFAKALGIDSVSVNANATAALTPISSVAEGDLEVPFVLSEELFWPPHDEFCGNIVIMRPQSSCSAWTYFKEKNSGTIQNTILPGLLDGTYEVPEVSVGDSLGTSEKDLGNAASKKFDELFMDRAECTVPDNFYDDNLSDEYCEEWVWEALSPVYSGGCTVSTSQDVTVLGFASVRITGVSNPGESNLHSIQATVLCEKFEGQRGGGSINTGTKGTIPNLVE